jgi:hypothetical protein
MSKIRATVARLARLAPRGGWDGGWVGGGSPGARARAAPGEEHLATARAVLARAGGIRGQDAIEP